MYKVVSSVVYAMQCIIDKGMYVVYIVYMYIYIYRVPLFHAQRDETYRLFRWKRI